MLSQYYVLRNTGALLSFVLFSHVLMEPKLTIVIRPDILHPRCVLLIGAAAGTKIV